MKVLVMFGSKSDANIYEPLKARLVQENFDVDFRMISVHRSPDLLDKELVGLDAHAVIAGAGLAAHLPGILASKVLLPVIGIPCAAAIGGVDSLFSILQMPFGIPVLTTAPNQYGTAVDLLSRLSKLELKFTFDKFHLVMERSSRALLHFQVLLERAKRIADKTGIPLEIGDRTKENEVNICLSEVRASDPEAPFFFGPIVKGSDEIRIVVPVLSDEAYRDPYSAMAVARKVESQSGTVFCGINNVGNAMLAALELANSGGNHSPFLINAKKGYIHA